MGRLFDQLLFDLHFSGRMERYQGWEEDFRRKLDEEIPAVSKDEAEQIVQAAREAAYGKPEEFSEEKVSGSLCRLPEDKILYTFQNACKKTAALLSAGVF